MYGHTVYKQRQLVKVDNKAASAVLDTCIYFFCFAAAYAYGNIGIAQIKLAFRKIADRKLFRVTVFKLILEAVGKGFEIFFAYFRGAEYVIECIFIQHRHFRAVCYLCSKVIQSFVDLCDNKAAQFFSRDFGDDLLESFLFLLTGHYEFAAENVLNYGNRSENIIPTGFNRLDGILSLSKGDLAVIAARPAVGKSAFVGNLAVRSSMSGYATALFSMEMSEAQVLDRIMSSVGRIPHNFLVKNSIEGKYDNELGRAVSYVFSKSKLFIDNRRCQTVRDIKRKCIKAKADVVIIDYLQLMRASRKYESKVNEVAEINSDLKIMAWDLNAVVILLSQLNRDVEKRAVPRPVLSDLRDSGFIEQDANSIIFLSKANLNNANSDILAEVAKKRSGAVGQVVFSFDRNIQTFAETDKNTRPKAAQKLYDVFKAWAKTNGEYAPTKQGFWKELSDRLTNGDKDKLLKIIRGIRYPTFTLTTEAKTTYKEAYGYDFSQS